MKRLQQHGATVVATAQPVTVTLYKLLPFRMKPGWKHTRFSLRNKPLRATTDRWVYYPPTEGLGKSGLQHGMDTREQPRARRGRRNLCQSALALFTSFREIAMQIGLHQVTASYDLAVDDAVSQRTPGCFPTVSHLMQRDAERSVLTRRVASPRLRDILQRDIPMHRLLPVRFSQNNFKVGRIIHIYNYTYMFQIKYENN